MQLKILLKRPLRPKLGCSSRRESPALSLLLLLITAGWFRHRPPTRLRRPPQAEHAAAIQLRSRKMEVEMQLDDDVFFDELSKRISLLITDDDDADFAAAAAAAQFPVAAMHLPPGFSMSSPHVPSMLAPPAYTLFHHAASYGATNSAGDAAGRAAAWQQQPQQQQKGTGVFIPRSTPGGAHSKRKGRNWSGSKAQKAQRAQAEGVVAAGTPVKRRA